MNPTGSSAPRALASDSCPSASRDKRGQCSCRPTPTECCAMGFECAPVAFECTVVLFEFRCGPIRVHCDPIRVSGGPIRVSVRSRSSALRAHSSFGVVAFDFAAVAFGGCFALRIIQAHDQEDRLRRHYWAVYPPSITSSLPVMNFDSSEARKTTPQPISSGSPTWPMGCKRSNSSRNFCTPSSERAECFHQRRPTPSLRHRAAPRVGGGAMKEPQTAHG